MIDQEQTIGEIANEIKLNPRPILHDITVVIPTLGRSMLEGCLQSIAAGNSWPANIIVVDQGSNPNVATWINTLRLLGMQIEHMSSSQSGVAAGTNRGLEQVESRFVAVTHDDCQVEPNWLQNIALRLRQNPDAIITGRIEPGGEGVVVSVNTSTIPTIYTRPLLRADILFPNNMGCAMNIFSQVGFFDENFRYAAEDNDWSYRALRTGISINYTPDVVVTHLDWRDDEQLAATYRVYARSQGGFYGKYIRQGDGFIAARAVSDFIRAVRRWLLYGIIYNNADQRANGYAWMTQLLPGIIAGIRHGR